MAAAVSAPASVNVGQAIVLSGTGFADSTAMTLTVRTPTESIDAEWKFTSSGGGAFTFATYGVVVPQEAGMYTVTASDGTSTVTAVVEVFAP